MTGLTPIRSDEIVVGCVTEDDPKFLGQTLRLLQSIRWFGGSLADARVVVGAIETIDRRARRTLESWGAEIRIVPRFPHPNGSANRLQLVPELLATTTATHFLMLDCDTIVVRDPLPFLPRDVFFAKIAPFPTVTHACFERLFVHFRLPLPERTFITPHSRTPTIAYFNAGVFSMSREIAERLVPEWRRFNAILADDPSLAAPCARHLHQAALTLALVTSVVPVVEAGVELNYQLNHPRRAPRFYAAADPVIVHYHDLVDADGLLLPYPFPRAQERIERFNDRLRRERIDRVIASGSRVEQQFVVLGAPRAGASLVAEILARMGAHAGNGDELVPSDVYRPNGTWRRRDVDALHRDVFAALGATLLEPDRADVSKLPAKAIAEYERRARHIAQGVTLLHDERMALLFPLWRDVMRNPFAVLVWREPLAVAHSLRRAAGLPLVVGLALWEAYTRRILSATATIPRVLVSYEEIARGDFSSVQATGLPPLDPAARNAILLPPADSAAGAGDDLLDAGQRELRDALRSGDALRWTSVPPARDETRTLLAAFGRNAAAAEEAQELRRCLDEISRSRAHRLGKRIAALWRRG